MKNRLLLICTLLSFTLVQSQCILDIQGPTIICSNQQNVQFQIGASFVSVNSWSSIPNTTVSYPNKSKRSVNVNFNGTPPGIYTISAFGTGCPTDSSRLPNINANLRVTIVAGPNFACLNGPITNALNFNGTNSYVEIPTISQVNAIGEGDFTFEARVKANTVQGKYPSILSNRNNGNGGMGFLLFLVTGTQAYEQGKPWLNIEGNNYICSGCPSFTDNQCRMLSVTRTSGILNFYVDGNLVSTRSGLGNISAPGLINIGRDIVANGTSFNGEISEVRIWNVARSATEVKASFNKSVSSTSRGLIGYWRLNEGYGQTVYSNCALYNIAGKRGSLLESNDINDPTWVSSCVGISKKKGSSFENPIDLGNLIDGSSVANSQSNIVANGFDDDVRRPSDDIVYSFSLSSNASVTIDLCSSNNGDSYVSIFKENRDFLLYNDDRGFGGVYCFIPSKPIIRANLRGGRYFVVVEGFGNLDQGDISTKISVDRWAQGEVYGRYGDSEQMAENTIELSKPYPNPIKGGVLYFGKHYSSYSLINSSGVVLKEGFGQEAVSIEGLPTGLYFLKLDQKIEKIVVE